MSADTLESWLPPAGSETYYAHLYLPPALRRRLGAIAALRKAIAGIPATCSSPDVAVTKLAWWREEMGQMARGTPRHVLTRALVEADPALPVAGVALVAGMEALLGGPGFATRSARRAALLNAHGPLWACALRSAVPGATPDAATLGLTAKVEEAWLLRDARPHLDGGLRLPCDDSLQHAAIPPPQGAAWHAAVFRGEIVELRAGLAQDLASLPGRRSLLALATEARLAVATLEEIERGGYRVWEERTALTPLRMLWLAWRERAGL